MSERTYDYICRTSRNLFGRLPVCNLVRERSFTQDTACQVLVCILAARPGKDTSLAAENGVQRLDASGASSSSSSEVVHQGPVGEVVVSFVEWLCQQVRLPYALHTHN
jgi:hypothetical protein